MKIYGSLMNRIAEVSKQPKPEVGMGATIMMYTDRIAATIIKVTAKSITVQEDVSTRVDNNGMSESQEYSYKSNPKGQIQVFRLRKRGGYRNKDGDGLLIGDRDHYYDYGF